MEKSDKTEIVELKQDPLTMEKGFRKVYGEDGTFVCNVIDTNGRLHSVFGDNMAERLESYRQNFPVFDDDLYLLTYPKSGTHWLWEILMMLTRGSAEPRTENKEELMLEEGIDITIQSSNEVDRPRIINTHLCVDDMPPSILNNQRAKFIQVHRNPADVAVSFYHHAVKEVKGMAMTCDWNYYISNVFTNDKIMPHSSWFDYTTRWLQHKHDGNFYHIYYEDLKSNPTEEIRQLSEFLGLKRDEELIASIAENTSFSKMKDVKHAKEVEALGQYFSEGYSMYRKGKVGDWRNHFNSTQHEQLMSAFNTRLQDYPDIHEKYSKLLQISDHQPQE